MNNELERFWFWNKPMTKFEKIQDLASKGFLCEVVTDAWANWSFDKDGKPNYDSATPSKKQVMFRGCCWYFDLNGKLIQDDTGLYETFESALDHLFDLYHKEIDNINKFGFKL